ncbi:hypothetical protein G7A66_08935 [Altererythrobacter sp. SALINAS58]|uniref:hypothetical protein n=1 Tax=Alteripontixanthobacter muriae TaxID=2705546 RepID=UPI0015757F21|nr:hypothetical protein [Alteripontixanthobacter muriae]NTZ43212.1 hypothetical protein [Alteripontixanthobacter muriae]
MKKATGLPILIPAAGPCQRLERIRLGAGVHDEDWLQSLIFDHPQLLPVGQIEPGFGDPLPVAREVPCAHGSIDNLYVTPTGEIVLVETKLWRNTQARREVVAQALDYVSALMKLGYEGFEAAVLKGMVVSGTTLYAIVAQHIDALDESAFVDAVSRNLSRGRMLVLVLGDGIRREAEALAELLQSHAGAHFTFALVELATWRNPLSGDILAVPGTLAQTVMIERGILRFEGAAPPLIEAASAKSEAKPTSLTEEMFMEALGKYDTSMPKAVQDFLQRIEPLGIAPEYLASLNLKVDLPFSERPTNFGYITKTGKFWTDTLSWTAPREIAMRYNEALRSLTGGSIVETDTGTIYLSTNGSSAPRIDALLPEHAAAWAEAMSEVISAARLAEKEGVL